MLHGGGRNSRGKRCDCLPMVDRPVMFASCCRIPPGHGAEGGDHPASAGRPAGARGAGHRARPACIVHQARLLY